LSRDTHNAALQYADVVGKIELIRVEFGPVITPVRPYNTGLRSIVE